MGYPPRNLVSKVIGANPLAVEVCVIGGGPAGAGVAQRLARLGYQVCLLEREPFPRPHLGESLPPSILPVLELFELRRQVEGAGFLRPQATLVHWAGVDQGRDVGEGEPGFQVDRGRFDALFLQAAWDAGVMVLQPVLARRPLSSPEGWIIPLAGESRFTSVQARFLVDAAGKGAGLRRSRQRYTPPTVAWYGYWAAPALLGAETRVEAGEGAWYWGAPLPDGSFNATVFIDAAEAKGLSPARRKARYLSLLARSKLLEGCLQGRLLTPVRACDAACYFDKEPVSASAIKVGEANFSIDPLSSQGVQAALVSAFQAGLAIHTLLSCPGNSQVAMAFYRERQQETVQRHQQWAAAYYTAQNNHQPHPFWRARAQTGSPAPPRPEPKSAPLAESQRLRLAGETRLVTMPVLSNNLITSGRAVTHPNLERPVAYLGEIALAPLLEGFQQGRTAEEIVEGWSQKVAPAQGWRLLKWLWAYGLVGPGYP